MAQNPKGMYVSVPSSHQFSSLETSTATSFSHVHLDRFYLA